RVRAEGTAVHPTQSLVELKTEVRNQHDRTVVTGASKVKMLEVVEPRPAGDGERFANAVAIVTGASRGIGAETARRLARDGFSVVVDYRSDHDGARRVADDIVRAQGRAIAVRGDVCVPADVRDI